ncbi:hypothetical protein O3P69_017581 [Scylla paramamosain]|uniref:BZIP domain-containing protein n=1 Tax=Scylla paramamosain TaxID=85552 RepID=A0AAW0TZK0_SCYPA
MERRIDPIASTRPRLRHGLSESDAAAPASYPSLLQQPSPFFAGAQPFPAADNMGEEEEDVNYRFRKVKMFEMAPSDDPEMEERRQRALYAKRNREIKKREVAQLQREKEELHTALQRYQVERTRMVDQSLDQQRKIEELERHLLDAHQQLRDKDEYIQKSKEKMSLLKAHLELIAEGLENNMSRKMLVTLLAQIDQNPHHV